MPEFLEQVLRLIVPRAFLGLKVRLFTLLVLGLAVDVGLRLRIEFRPTSGLPSVDLQFDASDAVIVASCAVTVVFLVTVDWILYLRRQRLHRDLLALVKDSAVPDPQKAKIIDFIIEQNRQAY